jgi:nicotinamidase-related amidase
VTPITQDAVYERLEAFRAENVFVGPHNRPDVEAGFAQLDFAPAARPVGEEGIAENGPQLAALCRAHGVNHLVYVGFAINWCLLMSPGGMVDMKRYGVMCSTIRDAVTAVENRETARDGREKQQALWRVALEFGFVFEADNFIGALAASR